MTAGATTRVRAIDKRAYFRSIGYAPHPRQWEYHQSGSRFKVPVCGRRFGKSTMAARDLEPELLLPKRWYWIVGPTYDLGEKEFRVIWDDMIIKKKLGQDKRLKKAYNKKSGDMYIEFPWRTRVEVRSADHPENLVGEGLHGVIMSEAAKQKDDTWERYIRPALADYRGWASFPTTPEGMNWLYKLWQFGQNPKFKEWAAWRFPSWENPFVYPNGYDDEEIQNMLREQTPEWFLQEIGADFTAFVGKVFAEFQEEAHVLQTEYKFNPAWPNYMGIDWGFTHPAAFVEFQVSPWDEVFVWREHVKSYWTLDQHMDYMMNRREHPPGYHLDIAFGDAADPEAAIRVSEKMVGCWALPEAKENWREGINCVKRFLKPRPPLHGPETIDEYGTPAPWVPGLRVSYECPNVIRQFNNYKGKQPPRTARNLSLPTDGAQKYDDDALDALRYGLMHVFELGCTAHLEDVLIGGTGGPLTIQDPLGLILPQGSGFFTSGKEF